MAMRKGIREVRSLSGPTGWGTHSKERHVYQFRIGALELERTRLSHEKNRFLERLRGIEERLSEIDREIRTHQAVLAGGAAPEPMPTMRALSATRSQKRTLRY